MTTEQIETIRNAGACEALHREYRSRLWQLQRCAGDIPKNDDENADKLFDKGVILIVEARQLLNEYHAAARGEVTSVRMKITDTTHK